MNWRILRPELPVQFKKGDAFCMLQPFPLDLLERFDCSCESPRSLPADLQKGFDDFAHRRSAAAVVAPQGGYRTQRDYFAGRYPTVPRPAIRRIRLQPPTARGPPTRRRHTA